MENSKTLFAYIQSVDREILRGGTNRRIILDKLKLCECFSKISGEREKRAPRYSLPLLSGKLSNIHKYLGEKLLTHVLYDAVRSFGNYILHVFPHPLW